MKYLLIYLVGAVIFGVILKLSGEDEIASDGYAILLWPILIPMGLIVLVVGYGLEIGEKVFNTVTDGIVFIINTIVEFIDNLFNPVPKE